MIRFFRAHVLFVAVVASLIAGGSLAVSGTAPAGASGSGIVVHCPADLQSAINNAAPGSTIKVDGTCTGTAFGGIYIDKDLTLSGPAILDGGGTGPALNVQSGTVVLNDLTLQHGAGIYSFGGGLWNGGQLTLNRSTVTNNSAFSVGGAFNYGQLTLNRSTVSHNTATYNGGGIFNCAGSFHEYGLCTGAPGVVTLNLSTVSDNAVASGNGGGIANDAQAHLTVNSSTVSGNTAGGSGGGIDNGPQANLTVNGSTVSGNTTGANGGGVDNNGTATLSWSTVSNNSSTGGSSTWSGGGGISNTGPTTLNNSAVRGNSATFIGGGIFAGGPMTITKTIVAGNSASSAGGGMVAWDGPTTVTSSVFWNNSDENTFGWDNPAGVAVGPVNYGGFFVNHPTFTTTQSIFR